jgi:hypothetical protein
MSALPPKADIAERNWDVRFVPDSDIDYINDTLIFIWRADSERGAGPFLPSSRRGRANR